MTNKVNTEELLESKELRQDLMGRVEVLNKVKTILTLPNTELLTTKMVAEYYEVSQDVIRDNIRRNENELISNGLAFKKYSEIKDIFGSEFNELGSEIISRLGINKRGVNVFSIRTLLNIGMLLRDSKIALEVRNQLLNGYEKLTNEQKVQSINEEDSLLLAIMKANNPIDQMVAISEYNNYQNRHKAELNARIEEMKPKEDYYNNLVDKKLLTNFRDTAKEFGIRQKEFISFLEDSKYVYRDTKGKLKPYSKYVPEYFAIKDFANNNKAGVQTMITVEGKNKFRELLDK